MKSMKNQFLFTFLAIFFSISLQAQEGMASYYADQYHGRKTASGELYNKDAMTAAHRTLPFGTYLRVTRVGTNQSVVVKVNDRGPYAKDRLIDLSKKAALALDLVTAGVANVIIEKVDGDAYNKSFSSVTTVSKTEFTSKEGTKKQVPTNVKQNSVYTIPGSFGVQIGSFSNYNNAITQINTLKSKSIETGLISVGQNADGSTLYRIILGPFSDRTSADMYKSSMKSTHKLTGFTVDLSNKSFISQ